MKRSQARLEREFGPLTGNPNVGGVTFDGQRVWAAVGDKLQSLDAETGEPGRAIPVPAHAGTAFDGRYLYQIAESRIQKIDAATGRVVASLPAPGNGGDSGLAWAEGVLWVGVYRDRKIHQIDADTGRLLRTIESNRYVTGVSWIQGQLWHATWEQDESEIRRVDPDTGDVLESIELPAGITVSGLEGDGSGRFFCGGGGTGKVRVLRRK